MAFTYRNPARSTEPQRILAGAASLVVGARSYRLPLRAAETPGPHGRVAQYAWIDHYALLTASLGAMADHLEHKGWQTRVVVDSNALVDREAAHRAGIGWYGKNANLLVPDHGSWFVLGSIVTDAPLETDEPVDDGCGSCRSCLDSCPTGAIVAEGVIDARRCLAWLVQARGVFPVEYREALGDRIYGCDDCQEVCPPNRVADRRGETAVTLADTPSTLGRQDWVHLLDVLGGSDEELIRDFGRWYIPDRDPDALRRNALVALANVGDPGDDRVPSTIDRLLRSPSALVRAHAVWAARRLGLVALLGTVRDDTDELVRAEFARSVDLRSDFR